MADHYLDQIGGRSESSRSLDVATEHLNGVYQTAQGSVTVDAALGDTVGLFPVPSHATLSHALSHVRWTALGTGATGDIGFAAKGDYAGDPDALAAGVDMAAAGSGALLTGLGPADVGKKVWQLAGMAKDPGGDLWVTLTFGGANPNSGTIAVEQAFVAK